MFDLEFKDGCSQRICMTSLIFNWKRVEFKTIFKTSQVLKVFVGGEMFTDASGEVSIGFTNKTGITACT